MARGEPAESVRFTQNWRGKPLRTWETVVELIGNTRTTAGLQVRSQLDPGTYPTGVVFSKAEMNALNLVKHPFQGEWNYELRPNQR